jgi:hypothetical protein
MNGVPIIILPIDIAIIHYTVDILVLLSLLYVSLIIHSYLSVVKQSAFSNKKHYLTLYYMENTPVSANIR